MSQLAFAISKLLNLAKSLAIFPFPSFIGQNPKIPFSLPVKETFILATDWSLVIGLLHNLRSCIFPLNVLPPITTGFKLVKLSVVVGFGASVEVSSISFSMMLNLGIDAS